MLVAPIREEVLLGFDLLQEADVQLRAKGSVYVQGQRVESRVISKGIGLVTSPVSLERDVTLQPNAEHIAWGRVEHPQPGMKDVLNPVQQVPRDVLVASTLVHVNQ